MLRTQIAFEVEFSDKSELTHMENFQEFSEIQGHLVRDLKFGVAGSQIFATWNTGHPRDKALANEVLICSYPELSDVSVADWSHRSRIEKNWGFFEENHRLNCIYSLTPLLSSFFEAKLGEGRVSFEAVDSQIDAHNPFRRWIAIGSQPIRVGDRLVLTAHFKPQFFKFRLYLPMIVNINLTTADFTFRFIRFSRTQGPSIKRSRFNPFAFAVNYASGFAPYRDGYLLGIGLADENYKLFFVRRNDVLFG